MPMHEKFYRHCYQVNDQWVPMMPLGSEVRLGDFGQIEGSQFLPLGNIFELPSLPGDAHNEPIIKTSNDIKLSALDWQMSYGTKEQTSVKKQERTQYEGLTQEGGEAELNRVEEKSIWFSEGGSFSFNCDQPKAQYILNWSQINQIIMMGLTLNDYSFREVYVITRVASVDHWELAIARSENASLKVLSRLQEDEHDYRSYERVGTQYISEGLDVFDYGIDRPAHFFKAKKLIMSDIKRDYYTRKILDQSDTLPSHIMANRVKTNLLNQVAKGELNHARFSEHKNQEDKFEPCCEIDIAPYFEFFDWADFSLDDIAQLC